LIPST
jgi:hypothetical protein